MRGFDAHAMRAALLLVVACGSHDQPPMVPRAEPSPAIDAATVAPVPPDGTLESCDPVAGERPPNGFLAAARVVHLAVVSARAGATKDRDRCVTLDLEILDNLRGTGEAKGEHVRLVVRQSMIEHYTSRPAGAWWIVEQTLDPGEQLVALCPAGPLATTLVGSCGVQEAAPVLPDLTFARDLEASALPIDAVMAKAKTACATLGWLGASYLWEKYGEAAVKPNGLPIFDQLAALLEQPSCKRPFQAAFDMALEGITIHDRTPLTRRLVLAQFRVLAQDPTDGLAENLVGTYLPNNVGLTSGMQKLSAAEVFKGEPARRVEARKALAAYPKQADALRAWLK